MKFLNTLLDWVVVCVCTLGYILTATGIIDNSNSDMILFAFMGYTLLRIMELKRDFAIMEISEK